jgi:hypothetical protein
MSDSSHRVIRHKQVPHEESIKSSPNQRSKTGQSIHSFNSKNNEVRTIVLEVAEPKSQLNQAPCHESSIVDLPRQSEA